ncbi:MAG: 30S ribosome-binding factor RbfA [Hyphomicrobiales bacterium]|jgi:ribosome-binding factor A|nr:30S ribosome-binding factor RbfA [Hyphomicrobiales bacterium]|tara:strand:- start:2314 stop:2697 length:384 start_codon:yes stop_codon:yes gene_type:complete
MLKIKNQKPVISQRQLRVGELIKKSLSDLLQKDVVHDPELLNRSITITQVMVSPDLKKATAYIIPLGGDNTELIVSALNQNSKYIRGKIAASLSLKFIPTVNFREDDSFKYAEKIDTILHKISQELN